MSTVVPKPWLNIGNALELLVYSGNTFPHETHEKHEKCFGFGAVTSRVRQPPDREASAAPLFLIPYNFFFNELNELRYSKLIPDLSNSFDEIARPIKPSFFD